MKHKFPIIGKIGVLLWLVVFLVAACSPSPTRQDEPAELDITDPLQEEAGLEDPAQSQDPPIGPPPSDAIVWMEDMIYPGAEFLLEVDGLGGPMTPWRIYAVSDASGEEVAEYYKQQLNWFVVENDQTLDGIRYLMLAHPAPMEFMNNVEGFEEIQEISQAMSGSLLGLEVTHSDVGAGLNRLGMAIDMHNIADQIPPNTTIVILEYFQNIY